METQKRTVQAINIAPVKSLGLAHPRTVHVGLAGILEDRRFLLMDGAGRLLTQRQVGKLVQVKAEYLLEPEALVLRFPCGKVVQGEPALGEVVFISIFGRLVRGSLVVGEWSEALSQFSGERVLLMKSDNPGQCYDEYPVSMVSQASVEELGRQPGALEKLDSRRFRPNFLIGGCHPHEEDSWLGGRIQIGQGLKLRVLARDPRCAITTHNPDTGERDMDTLRLILNYRPNRKAAYFGVYGSIESPGTVSIGDTVHPL